MSTTTIRRVCVFCGSRHGSRPLYAETARDLGRELVHRGLGLVYGGGSVGLMGVVADTVLSLGGEVRGVIPDKLAKKELMHAGLTELHVVRSMHERKALMTELADAFVALPGGFGTFDEVLEAVTWGQLGIHRKPIGLLNAGGYFDGLLRLIDHAIAEGFIDPRYRGLVLDAASVREVLDAIERYAPPEPILKVLGLEEV
jgi:hypothetical protein